MSLDNLPGLPQPSTLSSQSSRPSWTGDLPQCLHRWLPQVFLPQSTISVPPCELESPCWSWVNTRTSSPLPKGTLDFWLSWRLGTISAHPGTPHKLVLGHHQDLCKCTTLHYLSVLGQCQDLASQPSPHKVDRVNTLQRLSPICL